MPDFKIINHPRDVIPDGWREAANFKSKDRIVDDKGKPVTANYLGHQYRLVSKEERDFTCLERVGRVFFGTLAVVLSLGVALFSKSVRNLLIKQKETVRFGVLVLPTDLTEISQDDLTQETSFLLSPEIAATKPEKIPKVIYDKPEDLAAISIQRCVRGYLTRKPLLPSNLYSQYHAQCEKTKGPEEASMPQAPNGKTKVYLPQDTPEVILKYSGRKAAIKRFHQMQEVRSILDSQHSSHLIIPKALLCQDFLVEQRLPINTDNYHNMELYLSQPQLFDEAVRELTRLFSKMYLSDLISIQYHSLSHIEGVEGKVRHDNIPLYIVEKNGKKEGKIGLIDLEHIGKSSSQAPLGVLARIFPFHLDVIKEEASKLKIEINSGSLESAAKAGEKYLQVGYTDHINWLKEKGISVNMDPQPFKVSAQRESELTRLIEVELLNLNKGLIDPFRRKGYSTFDACPKDFLISAVEKAAKELASKIFPQIILNINAIIDKEKQNRPTTEAELVSLRSPFGKRARLYKAVDNMILESTKPELGWSECEANEIAEQITYTVMQELVKGGEIFYFDPAYYTGGHNNCWIRY